MRVEFFLAWRYLFRGKAHHIPFVSVVSCIGIVLGVATLVIVMSVMNGFDRDLAGKLLSFNYHLIVESYTPAALYEVKDEIKKLDDVESASLYAQTQVFCQCDDYIIPVAVRGIDFSDQQEKKLFYSFVRKETGDQGFFAGEALQQRFYLKDNISFYPLHKKPKLQEVPLRGIFRIGLYDLDSSYLIGSLEDTIALSDHYGLFLGVRTYHPFEAEKVKKRIERAYPSLIVSTWIDMNRVLFSALKLEKITMFFILSLIILVATFSVFSILMVKVVEKTKETGILKAVGFTAGNITAIFTLQGFILSVVGIVAGLAAGTGVCYLLEHYHFIEIPKEIYYIDYLPVYVSYRDLGAISLVSLLLSLAASIIPALRASRLSVCEALRYE